MDTLKMKFKLHSLEFEIEGNEATVKEEFQNFKSFITSELLSKINVVTTPAMNISQPQSEIRQIEHIAEHNGYDEYPVLKEVVMKDLPKNEIDWVLVYCFYASNYGEKPFTEGDIKEYYDKSNRREVNRMANFSNNFKRVVNKGFIKPLNDSDYILKPDGKENALQILGGNSISKHSKRAVSKSNMKGIEVDEEQKNDIKKSKKTRYQETVAIDKNLNLKTPGKKSFKEFYEEKQPKSTMDFNTVAVYYLIKVLGLSNVSMNHIYTCYKEVGYRAPEAFAQSLRDASNKKGYIDTSDMNDLKLPIRGENFIEHDLPKKG
jgi:hypothetical protein